MIVPALPQSLEPLAPFPLVTAQSSSSEFVAPGVRRAIYRLQTSDGPLVINVVAVDAREPTVRFASVIANDRLVSPGETVSAMAKRTGAVAGVNADYFDIGNTNQPLNAVVQNGALVRTPSTRVVLDVRTDRSIHFERLAFRGTIRYGSATIPLTGVNEWPPQGGVSYITPAYGALKAAPEVTLAEIVPVDAAHLASRVAGVYRVAAIDPAAQGNVAVTMLAFGPAAKAFGLPPVLGDTLMLEAQTEPPLELLTCAVGGGPLLVAEGRSVDDPSAPAPEERDRRFPVSGAASNSGGELFLIGVDGRRSAASIGVTRPQFAALMLALGARDGMAFDSGGSATLVARVLGDASASVLGAPSDGEERRVADGFFVYSDAPAGPAATIVVRPSPIIALPRATVAVRLALVDEAGHSLGAAHLPHGNAIRSGAVSSTERVRAGKLQTDVPVEVVDRLARLAIESDVRASQPNTIAHVVAAGYDARGRIVEVGDRVRWSADRGRFVAPGRFLTGTHDARIVARAAGARAELVLRVGRHSENVFFFDSTHAKEWRFASVPDRAGGSLAFTADSTELQLGYDFGGNQRAAYANGTFALPGEPLSFTVEIDGDGSGIGVRAAFVNRFGERYALTLARAVDWNGWQSRTVALPDDLTPPVQLTSLYVVNSLASRASRAAGTIAFRHPSVTLAGNP